MLQLGSSTENLSAFFDYILGAPSAAPIQFFCSLPEVGPPCLHLSISTRGDSSIIRVVDVVQSLLSCSSMSWCLWYCCFSCTTTLIKQYLEHSPSRSCFSRTFSSVPLRLCLPPRGSFAPVPGLLDHHASTTLHILYSLLRQPTTSTVSNCKWSHVAISQSGNITTNSDPTGHLSLHCFTCPELYMNLISIRKHCDSGLKVSLILLIVLYRINV